MTIDASAKSHVPDGFQPHFRRSSFTDPWEPLFSRRTDRGVTIGLHLGRPHTNARGFIHGGLIASLADNAMGYSCIQAMDRTSSLVTINLAVDFVGSAKIGQWLAVEGEAIRIGSTLCFAQSLIKADDAIVARASGTFRVVKRVDGGEERAVAVAERE